MQEMLEMWHGLKSPVVHAGEVCITGRCKCAKSQRISNMSSGIPVSFSESINLNYFYG